MRAEISELKCKITATPTADPLVYQGIATLPITARSLQGTNKPSK
jgi:hypothetical protein